MLRSWTWNCYGRGAMTHSVLLPSVAALLCILPVQDPEPTAFTLVSGGTITGRALAVEGETAVIRATIMGGSATIRRPLADFEPLSRYLIRLQASPPQDFEGHFAMAQYAHELGLLAQVGEHAGRARALAEEDESGAQRARLDAWVADALESAFDTALAQGDLTAARRRLRLLATRVPAERTEDQLGAMFDRLAAAEEEKRAARRAAAATREASARRAEQEQQWQRIVARVEEADALVREGLRQSRRTVQATRRYERAIETYRAAWQALEGLLAQRPDDAELQERAGRLGERIQSSAAEAALHAGNALTVQGDYRSALDWANRVLAMDPGNRDAKELIRTIQIAQAASGAWGRWGGGWGFNR